MICIARNKLLCYWILFYAYRDVYQRPQPFTHMTIYVFTQQEASYYATEFMCLWSFPGGCSSNWSICDPKLIYDCNKTYKKRCIDVYQWTQYECPDIRRDWEAVTEVSRYRGKQIRKGADTEESRYRGEQIPRRADTKESRYRRDQIPGAAAVTAFIAEFQRID